MFFRSKTESSRLEIFENLKSISSNKLGKTSNASKNIYKFKNIFNYQVRYKKLLFFKKWLSGRTTTGRISVFTKGSRVKKRLPFINYFFRDTSLFLMAGTNFVTFNNKISLLIISSSGRVSYIPAVFDISMFNILKLNSLLFNKINLYKNNLYFNFFYKIKELNFLLLQQKKNRPVSLLEITPLIGIKYTRSIGSKSFIKKMDTRTGLGLVILSSGLKKIASIYSLAFKGPASLLIFKKSLSNTKSGFFIKNGHKSKVRGVAKNPCDHPHGGRTKSIKHQRTPWGKTTKYK